MYPHPPKPPRAFAVRPSRPARRADAHESRRKTPHTRGDAAHRALTIQEAEKQGQRGREAERRRVFVWASVLRKLKDLKALWSKPISVNSTLYRFGLVFEDHFHSAHQLGVPVATSVQSVARAQSGSNGRAKGGVVRDGCAEGRRCTSAVASDSRREGTSQLRRFVSFCSASASATAARPARRPSMLRHRAARAIALLPSYLPPSRARARR